MQSAGRTGSPPISDGAGLVADPKAALASSTRSIQGKPGTVAEDIAASSPASAQSRIASNDGLLLEQPIHISPSHSNNVAHKKAAADLLGSEQNTGAGKVEARVNYGSTNNIPDSGLVQSGRSKPRAKWVSDSDSSSSESSSDDSSHGNDTGKDSEGYIDAEDTDSDEGFNDDVSISSSIGDPRDSSPGLHQVHPSAERLPVATAHFSDGDISKSKRESGLQVWNGRPNMEKFDDDSELSMDIKKSLQGRSPGFDWRVGDQIGSGAHGVVFRGLNQRNGALIAIKQIPIDGNIDVSVALVLQREVDILTELNHPHVIRYYGMEVRDNVVHLITEYVSGGSIADQLNQFGSMQEGLVCKHTRQIVVGLAFLHSHGVIHRDIKGQNILVSKHGILKLADFGAAQTFDGIGGGKRHALCGTPAFVAPEIILEVGHDDRADIWSLGCTIIQMLTAETPWKTGYQACGFASFGGPPKVA
eukprot:g3879.t1